MSPSILACLVLATTLQGDNRLVYRYRYKLYSQDSPVCAAFHIYKHDNTISRSNFNINLLIQFLLTIVIQSYYVTQSKIPQTALFEH